MRATADVVAAAGPDRLAGVRVIDVDEHRWARLSRRPHKRPGEPATVSGKRLGVIRASSMSNHVAPQQITLDL